MQVGKIQVRDWWPNLTCICIDQYKYDEYSGRIYHKYDNEAIRFFSVKELIMMLNNFFDMIDYPQAATKYRNFKNETSAKASSKKWPDLPPVVMETGLMLKQRGELATFLLYVRFRQNVTWQGEYLWLEEEEEGRFQSELDLIRLICTAVKEG